MKAVSSQPKLTVMSAFQSQCDWSESGIVELTGRVDGPALLPPGDAASAARALTRHIDTATGGRVCLDGARLLAERAAFTGWTRAGAMSLGGRSRLLESADGWAAVSCARPDDVALLGALISAEIGEDPWPPVAKWIARHSNADFDDRAELLGIAGGSVGWSPPSAPPQPGPPRDVDGMLVVDFSALWAGPLCAHLLGLAGARVVKVETPTRPDGARRGNAEFYRLLHGGHRSVILDPTAPRERRRLQSLVAAADIVIEASRPRALAAFGLDAKEHVRRGTTWISITSHGRLRNRVGFGDDVAASSGLVALDDDGAPLFVGDAIADPLAGLTAAACAMSGAGGRMWDISMSAVVSATLAGPTVAPSRPAPGLATPPQYRAPTGSAPAPGADTAEVLRELGIA